jgi:hypothetical protein
MGRFRELLVWHEHGGIECPHLEEKLPCNEDITCVKDSAPSMTSLSWMFAVWTIMATLAM